MQLSMITFDLGGTLIRPSPSVGETYAEICRVHGIAADSRRINRRFPSALKKWADHAAPRDDQHIWQSIVRDALKEESIPDSSFEPLFADLYAAYATAHRWGLMPAAQQILTTLRKRGFRLAVLSNSDSRMRKVLRELNLDAAFEAIFLSGEIGLEKPDPSLFSHVCRVCETSPKQMLHVGDSIHHDAGGAEASGWNHFLVRPDEGGLTSLPAVL